MNWKIPLLVCALGAAVLRFGGFGDLLTGLSGSMSLGHAQLQLAALAFCVSPLPGQLMLTLPTEDTPFEPQGDKASGNGTVNEGDYTKDSIYAFFYATYRALGKAPSPVGIDYQFTFNTWGFSDVPWIKKVEEEPQRHGKAAYQGLVEFETIKKALAGRKAPKFVEIGSGTGAGGDWLTKVVPGSTYVAIDMQMAAIETCRDLHARHNPNLECLWVEGGVGRNGGDTAAPIADHSVDVVVISETHIAEVDIGPEEIAIFAEITRMLKPDGFFVWGNALPTHVWHKGVEHLTSVGFKPCGSRNHTLGAVQARDEDAARVDMFTDHLVDYFWGSHVPYFGPRCGNVGAQLIKNFYRHPGTHMYQKMVTGYDSYMQLCFESNAKA